MSLLLNKRKSWSGFPVYENRRDIFVDFQKPFYNRIRITRIYLKYKERLVKFHEGDSLPYKAAIRLAALILAIALAVINVIAMMLLLVGSFVMGPLMFFILGCGIYTVFKHDWGQTFLLFLMESACILILFASGTVLFLLEEGREGLMAFALGG